MEFFVFNRKESQACLTHTFDINVADVLQDGTGDSQNKSSKVLPYEDNFLRDAKEFCEF